MNRGAFTKLNEPRWVKLFDGRDLEVKLVPGKMPETTTARMLGLSTEQLERRVCEHAFVAFRNWKDTDDGPDVPNTIEERLAMYRIAPIRDAITMHANVINGQAAQGEEGAASD